MSQSHRVSMQMGTSEKRTYRETGNHPQHSQEEELEKGWVQDCKSAAQGREHVPGFLGSVLWDSEAGERSFQPLLSEAFLGPQRENLLL